MLFFANTQQPMHEDVSLEEALIELAELADESNSLNEEVMQATFSVYSNESLHEAADANGKSPAKVSLWKKIKDTAAKYLAKLRVIANKVIAAVMSRLRNLALRFVKKDGQVMLPKGSVRVVYAVNNLLSTVSTLAHGLMAKIKAFITRKDLDQGAANAAYGAERAKFVKAIAEGRKVISEALKAVKADEKTERFTKAEVAKLEKIAADAKANADKLTAEAEAINAASDSGEDAKTIEAKMTAARDAKYVATQLVNAISPALTRMLSAVKAPAASEGAGEAAAQPA